MQLDPKDLSRLDRYRLMVATVIPRPVGWTSTLSDEGVPNLAPFSFFGGVSADPPVVMLSVGRRKGARKDTAMNILANREAVVHIATRPLAEAMVASAVEADAAVDEFEFAGLTKVPSEKVRPFRVGEAAIAMETKMMSHQEVGNAPVDLFLLEVVQFHFEDTVLTDGRPDPERLKAVGRLGGTAYCDTAQIFNMARPPKP